MRFDGAPAERLDADAATAWHMAQALLAAESLGAVERALEMSVGYAKERFTFGRAIGSYQSARSKSTGWLTPTGIIQAVGPFDVGSMRPRSLNRPWPPVARCWCNPPFSPHEGSTGFAFVRRMPAHGCGTALLFTRTERGCGSRRSDPTRA